MAADCKNTGWFNATESVRAQICMPESLVGAAADGVRKRSLGGARASASQSSPLLLGLLRSSCPSVANTRANWPRQPKQK